jgi:hypothetical protein
MMEQFSYYLNPSRWDRNTYWVVGLVLGGLVCIVAPVLWRNRPRPRRSRAVPPPPLLAPQRDGAPPPPRLGPSQPDRLASGDERRTAPRRKDNPIEVHISDAAARAAPAPGRVVDRSVGGLCLAVSDPVEVGTILSVRPATAPASIPWVQIEVRRQTVRAGYWELGCAFVQRPPLSVILLFG